MTAANTKTQTYKKQEKHIQLWM